MKSKTEILFEKNELASSVDFINDLIIICNTHLNCADDELATKDLKIFK